MEKITVVKPVYSVDKDLMCGVIKYNERTYLLDLEDRDRIINFSKKFLFQKSSDIYPSFNYNEQTISYLMFLYNFKEENVRYVFKNENPMDLRRCNVEYYHKYHYEIIENYEVIEYIPGHYSQHGVDPYFMKNPLWKIEENGEEYLLMYCEKDTICKLCPESYKKLLEFEEIHNAGKKITWYKLQNGYIMNSNNIYIHQIITDCYGNGKGTKTISVDHIDRNPLNNTMQNLRLASREEQEQNSKGIAPNTKRERHSNAQKLPPGISHEMMKKYVYYCHEWRDKEKTKEREYFRVEKHPNQPKKQWSSSKSCTVSILEKLKQANDYIDELDKL